MNFVGAEAECASIGARLCTIEELGSGEAHGTGCGFDSERVWTSSVGSCGTAWGTTASHLSAHGHPNEWSSSEGAPECTEDSTVLAVRCCADETAGLLSCSSSSAAQMSSGSCTSLRSCSDLGWALEPEDDVVCAAADDSALGCAHASYHDAWTVCQNAGSRLCTMDELAGSEAAGTGCSFDSERTWSSTAGVCDAGYHMSAAGTPAQWGPLPPDCSDDAASLAVRCCADANVYNDLHCDRPCTSRMTCEALSWDAGEDGEVCGSSPGCATSSNWRHAALICESEGGRLCTVDEVRRGEAQGTGCGYDSERIWTADVSVCGRGAHMSAGGAASGWSSGMGPECSADGTDHKVRCCADSEAGEVCEVPCTSTRSCEELSLIHI